MNSLTVSMDEDSRQKMDNLRNLARLLGRMMLLAALLILRLKK
uniref:Alternative protein HNRNPUL2 n=1 Tax=Homo sapiens TaxID=9606 RepID=L8E7F7_HUMAN|nr:alternative protein HNRNPUL2 [Homo sapiens]